MPEYAGKGLRFAPKGCHSSPGLKAWGFLAWLINDQGKGKEQFFILIYWVKITEESPVEKVTEKIAEFICNTHYENIPREVLEVSKLHILDTLGVLIAGSKEDVTGIIKRYIQSLGAGKNPHSSRRE